MKNRLLIVLVFMLVGGVLSSFGVAAQVNQPPTPTPPNLFMTDLTSVPVVPLLSQDILAPGCVLTSPEAGVYQVVCDNDLGASGIPTVNGEILSQGCELTTPEAGVFILDCNVEPVQPVPVIPGPLTIEANAVGNSPSDIASQPDDCENAAESYMAPGMLAIRNTIISFDDIVYNNQDEELVLFALYSLEALEFSSSRNRFSEPGSWDIVGAFNNGDIVTIGEQSLCIRDDNMTVRLWQLDNGEWVFDSIRFNEAANLSDMWQGDVPNPQNPGQIVAQPVFPILVDGVQFNYLMPYIEPPVTTLPGATEVDSDQPANVNACEYAAPSYLAVGMNVMLNGYGYEQLPQNLESDPLDWTFTDTHYQLNDHGTAVYNNLRQLIPLMNETGFDLLPQAQRFEFMFGLLAPNFVDSYNLEVIPAATLIDAITVGEVVAGPLCTSETAQPVEQLNGNAASLEEADGFGEPQRFYTWWQVEVNGQVGWYPENVGQYSSWLWETDGMFPRKLSLYYMVPFNAMMEPENAVCPPVRLFAGQTVQPAVGAMNLRETPNGQVIGRVDRGQAITVFDAPTCEGGVNWWATNAGGFIAENDPTTGLPLVVQFVPPAVVPTLAQPTTSEQPIQPATVVIESQPEPVVTEAPRQPDSSASPGTTPIVIEPIPIVPPRSGDR